MLTSVDRYQFELQKLILAEIERLKEIIASGNCNSFEEYRTLSGKIQGMKIALDQLDEANAIVNGRE